MHLPRQTTLILGLAVVVVAISAYNATLIFDDLYLDVHFKVVDERLTAWSLVRYIGLNLDLGAGQYRLYGLSRLIQFTLWKAFGSQAVLYAVFIAVTQIASGYGIKKLLMRAGADEVQANAAWAAWVFSAFAVTSCFHHYSYLILPYQFTILCALVLRFRTASFALGVAIALSGEAHLAASCVLLALVALSAENRSKRDRFIDAGIPIIAILGAVIVHRLVWQSLIGQGSGQARYMFGLASVSEIFARTYVWLGSLVRGITDQIIDVLAISGAWSVLVVVVIVAAGAFTRHNLRGGSEKPAIGIISVCVASFFVLWALGTFTGQVSGSLQRRYGYVPYTLCVMAAVVTLLTPRVRNAFGVGPAVAALSVSTALWMLLQFVALPIIRSQDQQVWNVVSRSLAAKGPDASILFVSSAYSDIPKRPRIEAVDSVAFRPGVSAIFESAFQGFWWQAQYAIVVSGAVFSAYRWEEIDSDHVKLFGNEVNGLPARIVSKSKIVVLFDERKDPRSANDPRGVTTFTDWQKFTDSPAAKGLL